MDRKHSLSSSSSISFRSNYNRKKTKKDDEDDEKRGHYNDDNNRNYGGNRRNYDNRYVPSFTESERLNEHDDYHHHHRQQQHNRYSSGRSSNRDYNRGGDDNYHHHHHQHHHHSDNRPRRDFNDDHGHRHHSDSMDRSRRDFKDDDHQHRHRHHHQDSTNRPKRNDDNDELRQQNRSTIIRNVSDRQQQQSSTEMTSLNSSFSTLLGQNSREGGGKKPYHHSSLPEFPVSKNYEIAVAKQPPVEQQGESKKLTGNYFKLSTRKILVYHYDVQFSQYSKDSKEKKSSIEITKSENEKLENLVKDKVGASGSGDQNIDSTTAEPKIDDREKIFLKRNSYRIIEQFVKENSKHFNLPYVYDGWANLYICHQLKIEDFINDIDYVAGCGGDRDGGGGGGCTRKVSQKMTKVQLNLVDKINLGMVDDYFQRKSTKLPTKIINIYNLVFHNILQDHFVHNHSRYFNMDNIIDDKQYPYLEFVFGFELSVRMSQIGLSLVINPRVGCLLTRKKRKLIDIIKLMQTEFPKKIDFNSINSLLKNITIYTEHGERKRYYNFHSLLPNGPESIFFEDGCGEKLSVFEYFSQRYHLHLDVQNPLILAKSKNDRNNNKKNYLPLELCYLGKLQFINPNKSSNDIQTAALKKSEFKPENFFHCIQNYIDRLIEIDSNLLNVFGLQIDNQPALFNGYQLEQPEFINSNPFRITESGSNENWALISFDKHINDRTLERFSYQLEMEANKMNIQLGYMEQKKIFDIHSIEEISPVFSELYRLNIRFCLVIIPDRNSHLDPQKIYGACSSVCTQDFSITLQCLNASRVRNPPRGYFTNLLFEINGKRGGQNQVISPNFLRQKLPNINFEKTMVIGLDVNHPGFREVVPISIAAAAGTYDPQLTQYISTARIQKLDRTEMIHHLDEMIKELLAHYYHHNDKQFPEHLIIFRDGVSEGQFDTVTKEEIPLIRKAIDEKITRKTGKQVSLTLIIVQKRHHTRFVTTEPYSINRSGRMTRNVPSGTIVDNTIVEPNFDIFYVNSHFSILGTSRPTKYFVSVNELNLSNAELQRLCFFVCFNCVRHKTPMSIPTPVMYADLCAYKSKIHIMYRLSTERTYNDDDILDIDFEFEDPLDSSNRSAESLEKERRQIQRFQQWVRIPDNSKDCLFFV
uniref:Protein argonaute 4A-like n=1 Tax=Dermatophagoides pteronyssinus TaxID=6956 RepID=A0A6P6YL65_DERPT|nr:protein argonaute 4A-like [Dermatophagoides pteronyssinus]